MPQVVLFTILFLILRLLPISGGNFPYAYDNAKDSLALLSMWTEKKPVLLGAVTSMEGLYQGPLWYYVFLPLNIFLQFHPFASVLTVIILGLCTMYLLYYIVGKFHAFLYMASTAVIASQQTAWSPYLTMFSTTWALILFLKIKQKSKTIYFILLAACIGLLFHAEIAFGVVFVVLTFIVFWKNAIRPRFLQLALAFLTFSMLFIPQAIFEVRHNFLETKSVLRFLKNFEQEKGKVSQNSTGFFRVREVATYMTDNALQSITPYSFASSAPLSISIAIIFILLLARERNRLHPHLTTIIFPVILGTFLCYLVLPIKPFYLVGLTPFWLFTFGTLIHSRSIYVRFGVLSLFTIASLFYAFHSKSQYLQLATTSTVVFAPKLSAVQKAYEFTQGKPFISYHYVPEVYDYTYQHIYRYLSFAHELELPVEFSYAPGKTDYLQDKKNSTSEMLTKETILITEKEDRSHFFLPWWKARMEGKRIVREEKINDAITVYLLEPTSP